MPLLLLKKKKTTSTKKFSPVRAISLCASEDVLTALKAPAEDNAAYKSVFTQESPGYPTTAVTQTTGREGTRVKMGQGKRLARRDSKLWDNAERTRGVPEKCTLTGESMFRPKYINFLFHSHCKTSLWSTVTFDYYM